MPHGWARISRLRPVRSGLVDFLNDREVGSLLRASALHHEDVAHGAPAEPDELGRRRSPIPVEGEDHPVVASGAAQDPIGLGDRVFGGDLLVEEEEVRVVAEGKLVGERAEAERRGDLPRAREFHFALEPVDAFQLVRHRGFSVARIAHW